ncbi:MAG: Maf-like protein [Thermotogales bacterium 46_20]|nr:MAG: Maf-like protein [Thermotogales bacterium 46_20]
MEPMHGEELIGEGNIEDEVLRLARKKVFSIKDTPESGLILGADTVVICEGVVLGKPQNRDNAIEMLRNLSGKMHSVLTGVVIASEDEVIEFVEKTDVEFRELPEGLINDYVDSGLAMDKAGSYGIQDRGAVFVKRIVGDFYNVMGLPVGRIWEILHERGALAV